jgi:hypothetical protein
LPVSGRQNLARRPDFDADDMAIGIEIINERPGFFRPLDPADPDGDIHRVGFGIVSCVGHGFALALRSNNTLVTRMFELANFWPPPEDALLWERPGVGGDGGSISLAKRWFPTLPKCL